MGGGRGEGGVLEEAVPAETSRGHAAPKGQSISMERRELLESNARALGNSPQPESDLESLAVQAFLVFESDPNSWPDKVEINRNGLSDINIVATWLYDRDREFVNQPLGSWVRDEAASRATSPPDSGGAE